MVKIFDIYVQKRALFIIKSAQNFILKNIWQNNIGFFKKFC